MSRPTALVVPDSPKMLRESLCVAQARIGNSPLDADRRDEHTDRIGRLIAECDRHRPLGPDGRHGDRHTPTCGCDDTAGALTDETTLAETIRMARFSGDVAALTGRHRTHADMVAAAVDAAIRGAVANGLLTLTPDANHRLYEGYMVLGSEES